MKVLDLQCRQGHSFEGWFGSQDDYDAQRERGLVTCPVCNDSDIVKLLSAPRLNLRHGNSHALPQESSLPNASSLASASASLPAIATPPDSPEGHALAQMQANLLKMVRHVMANTEDVGTQFAEEARKIHYGESEDRSIRGQATRDETEALLEEGIDVVPLPVPDALKGTVH